MTNSRDAARRRSATVAERLHASALTDDMSFLLARANSLSLAAGNAVLSEYGLRVRSYSVLALVADDSRPSQRNLAEYLRLDPSQVVALIDELQKHGLVTREPDTADRRMNVVAVTAEGRELFQSAQQAVRRAERQTHGHLTAEQRNQLGELLLLMAFPG
ncbi:MAG: MarR family winged helix-turn-helix transcriptional regulator [Rhodoglobus sp.]